MSSRALKKLQQQKGSDDLILTGKLAEQNEIIDDEEEEEVEGAMEVTKSKKKKKKKANLREQQGNLFDLVNTFLFITSNISCTVLLHRPKVAPLDIRR